MWFFRACSPSRNDTTPIQTTWSSGLSTSHWTVQFSEAAWSSTTGSIITSQGNTGPEQQDTRDLCKLQQTPNLCEVYTDVYNMQQQSSHLRKKLHIVQGNPAREKNRQTVAGAKKNVGIENRNQKVYKPQVLGYRDKKTFPCYARENAASKSHLLGRRKTQSARRTPHLSFLPSVAASCVGLFLFIYNSKLENLAIKLVEIGSEKHKFPNFFLLKRGNFVLKKHWCLQYG